MTDEQAELALHYLRARGLTNFDQAVRETATLYAAAEWYRDRGGAEWSECLDFAQSYAREALPPGLIPLSEQPFTRELSEAEYEAAFDFLRQHHCGWPEALEAVTGRRRIGVDVQPAGEAEPRRAGSEHR